MPTIDSLALEFLKADQVSAASFRVIDALQDFRPAVQVASVAALFVLLCEHYQIAYPQEELGRASRILNDSENFDTTNAIRRYIREGLR